MALSRSDLKQLKDIHSKFGNLKLDKFPTADIFKYKFYYRFVKSIKVIQPLNMIKYIKSEAVDLRENLIGKSIHINIMNLDLQNFMKDIGY